MIEHDACLQYEKYCNSAPLFLFQRLNEFQRLELQFALRELECQGASAEAERRAMAEKMAALLADREGEPKTMNNQ